MKYYFNYRSCLGNIVMESDGEYLIGLVFSDEKNSTSLDIFNKTSMWLDSYFKGEIPNINIKYKYKGTDFQRLVWKIIEEIPYGDTMSYGEIASNIAKQRGIPKMSAQAVGQAVGANPIAIIIPCHRVTKINKRLGGYSGGIEKKRVLLDLERCDYIDEEDCPNE